MSGLIRRHGRTITVLSVCTVAIVAAFASTSSGAAKKPLTKKKALKLFYTEAESDALFLTEGEGDARFIQQGNVLSVSGETPSATFPGAALTLPGMGRINFGCHTTGTPQPWFTNESGATATVAWHVRDSMDGLEAEYHDDVANNNDSTPPIGPAGQVGADVWGEFWIHAGGKFATVVILVTAGAPGCKYAAQATIDAI